LTEEEQLEEYKAGSIRRVRLKNFLTYSDVEFFPGPRLNVVVGPNGTGKSTILCAICLGLGGQPPLLGRADDARQFIMHEKELAEIEIELAPHKPESPNAAHQKHIIRRIIDRNKGSERGRGAGASTYFINGSSVPLKKVQQLVHEEYQIAIDNLCTFLPQDRVGSFSGFNPQMLLQETEKSLSGSQHLFKTHMELVELENELRTSGSSVETIGDKLKHLQAENDRLEREKELMEERAEYEKKLDLLQKKKVWLQFDEARIRAVEIKEEKDSLKMEEKQVRVALRPLEEKEAKLTSDVSRMKGRFAALDKTLRQSQKEYEKCLRKAENYTDEMETSMSDLHALDSIQRQAERRVTTQKEKVESLEAQMGDYPPENEIEDMINEARNSATDCRKKVQLTKIELGRVAQQLKEREQEEQASRAKLTKMNDDRARRKERIFRQHPKLYETYSWLDQNRKMFRRPVWGPIACEITTKSVNTAAYLEQHVPNSFLKAYVVECKEDYNLLYREVREKRRLAINVVLVENGKLSNISRMYSDRKLRVLKQDHGVMGYLDESFSAPDAIVEALRNTASIHCVLVGSEKTQESIDRHKLIDYLSEREDGKPGLMNSCIFSCHLDRSYKYTSQVSRYSGKANMRVDDITPAKMLAPGVDPEQKANLESAIQELQEEIGILRPQVDEAKCQYDDALSKGQAVTQRLKDARAAKNDLNIFKNRLIVAKRKLAELEESASKDNVAEKESILRKLKSQVKNNIDQLEIAASSHNDMMKITYTSAGVKMTEDGLSERKRRVTENLADKRAEHSALEERMAQVTRQFNEAKRQMRDLKTKADSVAPMKDADGNELPLKAQLEELPETLDEVEATIEEAVAKINSIQHNPSVLRLYEERKREIEETRREMEGLSEAQNAKRTHMDSLRIPWENSLINVVNKVNVLFGQYMAELGNAGEVTLENGVVDGDSEQWANFKDWGVQIKVRFREKSSLQVLTAQVQSGGERSVSTIMYLMALQELMVSPFRCVDEINQGLDERNERLVFKRIVTNSTKPPTDQLDKRSHCGQYFLITPKLLPNLTDMENENVTILFIFNGPYNFKHFSDWNTDKFLADRKRSSPDSVEEEEEEALNQGIAGVKEEPQDLPEPDISTNQRKNKRKSRRISD